MFDKYIHEDIEQALISRFIDNPKEMYNCSDLKEETFNFEVHRKIYRTLIDLQVKAIPITPKNIFDIVGEKDYIMSLCGICTATPVKEMCRYLIDESEKYRTLNEMQDIIINSEEDKNFNLFERLSELSVREQGYDNYVSDEKMLYDLQERMKKGITGISTTINDLDNSINAFQNGRLYIVGARPSMGKSAFMCSLVEQMEKKNKIGILSLEMNSSELRQRIACLRSNIKHWKIEKGRCNDIEFNDYANALKSIHNVIINDKGGLNRGQVVAIIRNMVIKSKCEIIFIDHLGLIKTEKGNNNLAHEIGENTATLKSLSKELGIPIVCLCQLNRAVEKEKRKEPSLSDLRDSGRIEEDADCVILLYRDNYYDDNAEGIAKYIVAKCRNGKTGVVYGAFENELMKWR